MQRSLTLVVLLVISSLSTQATATAARFALVIGNAGYDSSTLSPLNNPANDAVLISNSLEKAGFEVTMIVDADLRAMKKAIKKFGTKLAGEDSGTTALFYFSGHGFQANNLTA